MLNSQISSKRDVSHKIIPVKRFEKTHRRVMTMHTNQNLKRPIANIQTNIMKLNTENTAREEEIKQNPQRLSLPKPINIDLGTERIKSILPTEKLRENFDFYSYLDDKNKLKNLKFKIKSLKHQAVNIFQSEL